MAADCTDLLKSSFLHGELYYSSEWNHNDRARGHCPAENDGPARVVVCAVVGQLRVTVDAQHEHHLTTEPIS